jgi:archaeosine-15-forming tRNA-guanine transglycosylase
MIKSRDCLDSNFSLKFNDTIIERQKNDIYFRQISQSDHFQLIQNVDIAITSSKNKIRLVLTSKEQYVTQRARDAYVASICQSKASFDLFLAV